MVILLAKSQKGDTTIQFRHTSLQSQVLPGFKKCHRFCGLDSFLALVVVVLKQDLTLYPHNPKTCYVA